jgi:hypothetical protein
MTINDLYRNLFGRGGTTKGSDIDMAEHGRAGGLSTGQPFKYTGNVEHKFLIDRDGQGNPIYIGMAKIGTSTSDPLWQIRKLTFDGSNNVTAIEYAGGTNSFNSIWDSRSDGTYTYS